MLHAIYKMTISSLRIGFATIVALLLLTSFGRADLLVDPAGGTTLFSDAETHDDEVVSGRSLGFDFSFFGTHLTAVDVNTNGNLNASEGADFLNVSLPTLFGPQICPYWDDLLISAGDGASVVEKRSSGLYSVTWKGLEASPGSVGRNSFQAVLFGAALSLGGFDFKPGDIAFAYGRLDAPMGEPEGYATLGLDGGDGEHAAVLAELPSRNGLLQDSDRSLIPTSAGSFVLFRPSSPDTYEARIVNAAPVPEPSTIAGVGLATAASLRRRKGRP